MPGVALTPRVQMMTLCDGVKESRREAGVYHLKGVRQQITGRKCPFVARRLWLFLILSSPRAGEFPCYVRVVNDRTDRTVFYGYLEPHPQFDIGGGLWVSSTQIRCSFPETGRYTAQVWFFQEHGSDILKGELHFFVNVEDE